jgi:hypothetical protein
MRIRFVVTTVAGNKYTSNNAEVDRATYDEAVEALTNAVGSGSGYYQHNEGTALRLFPMRSVESIVVEMV